MKYKTLSRG